MPGLTLYFKCPTYGVRELLVPSLSGSDRAAAHWLEKRKGKKSRRRRRRRGRGKKNSHLPGEMIQGVGESREANKVGAISRGGGDNGGGLVSPRPAAWSHSARRVTPES